MSPLPSVTAAVRGRLTYVNDAQDRRLPCGARIRIDGDAALPYTAVVRGRQVGPAVASYEAAVALLDRESP
jgi:hypothetical protein